MSANPFNQTIWKVVGLLVTLFGVVAAYGMGAGRMSQKVDDLKENKLDKTEYQKDRVVLESSLGQIRSQQDVDHAVLVRIEQKLDKR